VAHGWPWPVPTGTAQSRGAASDHPARPSACARGRWQLAARAAPSARSGVVQLPGRPGSVVGVVAGQGGGQVVDVAGCSACVHARHGLWLSGWSFRTGEGAMRGMNGQLKSAEHG
jgi:hypothetical protein